MTCNMKMILEGKVPSQAEDHVKILEEDREGYISRVLSQIELGGIEKEVKKNVVFACIAKGMWDVLDEVVKKGRLDVHEMREICTVLDSQRKTAAVKRSLEQEAVKLDGKEQEKEAVKRFKPDVAAALQFSPSPSQYVTRPTRGSPVRCSDTPYQTAAGSARKAVFSGAGGKAFTKKQKSSLSYRYSMQSKFVKKRCQRAVRLEADLARVANLADRNPIPKLTLSGGVCLHLKKWFSTLPKSALESALLMQSPLTWRLVAKLLHANPSDMQMPEFLPCIFEPRRARPANVEHALRLTEAQLYDFNALIIHQPHIGYLKKKFKQSIPSVTKLTVARYSKIEDCLKWYTAVRCAGVDELLEERLKNDGVWPDFTFGEILERLQAFDRMNATSMLNCLLPIAESKMLDDTMPFKDGTLVLCQCDEGTSARFADAVLYSTMLAALTGGELQLFSEKLYPPLFRPAAVKDALILSKYTQRVGKTCSLSAALDPFLMDTAEPLNTLVLVLSGTLTDTEEACAKIVAYNTTRRLHVTVVDFCSNTLGSKLAENGVSVADFKSKQYLDTFNAVYMDLVRQSDHYEAAMGVLQGFAKELPLENVKCLTAKMKGFNEGTVMEVLEEGLVMMGDEKEVKFKSALQKAVAWKVLQNVGDKILQKKHLKAGDVRRDMEYWYTGPVERTWRLPEVPPGLRVIDVARLKMILSFLMKADLHSASKTCKSWRYLSLEAHYDEQHQILTWPAVAMKTLVEKGLVHKFGRKKCFQAALKTKGDCDAVAQLLYEKR
eukprot:TRINITY_DN24040_c0_g1_i1.p1 TRINITY_DN24040_c0_g1~~TRINITY_DN24040_c0_g1_i1.p1  ORF type:complete len:777 (+),score=161.50 TRINITY_DN24040_c0_g1_i1:61-2391(+)